MTGGISNFGIVTGFAFSGGSTTLPPAGGCVFVSPGFVAEAGSPLFAAAPVAGEGADSGLGVTIAGEPAGLGAAAAELADWPFAWPATRSAKSAITKRYFIIQETASSNAQRKTQL
jgi:hypothetical protein